MNNKEFSIQLLQWWDRGHRDLPWRDRGDPYAIWIAEIMLQQTQIATVVPYYERWMTRFPDVESLSRAPVDAVLKMWEGLGYYSRARNIHAAAKIIVDSHDGRLPVTVKELIELPGIGRYTAGAIASIAFDQQEPVVDGNVTRVLSRLTDLDEDVSQSATKRKLWQLACSLMPSQRCGDYNQALMEMGQLICVATRPMCHLCPVSNLCLARQSGTQYERPVRPRRKKTPHHDVVAGVIWRSTITAENQFLITRRPFDGMLGGLWEFPGGKLEPGESFQEALRREIGEELAIKIRVGSSLGTIKHAYTHFRITLHVFNAQYEDGALQHIGVIDHAWVTMEEVNKYAFAATDLQIIERLGQMFSQP